MTVDDWLPVLGDGSFAYARSRQGELWVPLIEKAYAKLFGSYDPILCFMSFFFFFFFVSPPPSFLKRGKMSYQP